MVRHHRVLEEVGPDVDHPPRAGGFQVGQRRLDDVDRSLHRAGELVGEGPVVDVVRTGPAVTVEGEVDEGVVHHGRDRRVEGLPSRGDQGVHLGSVAHVGAHRDGTTRMVRDQLLGRPVTAVVVHHDPGAFPEKGFADAAAETTRTAGDDDDLIGEWDRHGRAAGCIL